MTDGFIWSDDSYAADQRRFEKQEARMTTARRVGQMIRDQYSPSSATPHHMPFPGHRTVADWWAAK